MNDQNTTPMVDVDSMDFDVLDFLWLLWKKMWLLVISMVLCASLAFTAAMLSIKPTYTAQAMMYVNNSSVAVGGTSITFSSSQLSAAKSLLDVYVIILRSRTTLEAAIEKADLDYTYGQLRSIVSASSVNNTEVFTITATCGDPDEAKLIVDTLVDILPDRIADIVDGSSVRVVDRAVRSGARSNPSNNRYVLIGAVLGLMLGCGIVVVQELMNTTVRDEEYLKQRYSIPILAVVPDVHSGSRKPYYRHGYRYAYKSYYGKSARGYYASIVDDPADINQAQEGEGK